VSSFEDVEAAFNELLDVSLHPRGPELLYELVAGIGLPPGARAVDVGAGRGTHARVLAERFGLDVVAVDPADDTGRAEALPLEDASVDLVWCRDVLSLVEDVGAAFREFRRVLRPGARAIIFLMLVGPRFDPRDVEEILLPLECHPSSLDELTVEEAIASAGFEIERRVEIGSEWGEHAEEREGKPGRRLLWAARLLREPERYVERFGEAHYRTMLADCLWHVGAMTGKLSRRAYVLA
jgi:SAM-dependent methyltransferase